MLSLSLRQAGITGLPVDEKPDLIRVAAADAAALVGLLLEPLVLGMLRNGVGAVLSGVRVRDSGDLNPCDP